MLTDHPSIRDFEGFLRNAAGPESVARNARILRHLLAECSSCRDRLQAMGWGEQRLERLFRFPVLREEDSGAETAAYDYSRSFAAAEQALHALFVEGRAAESTPDLVRKLVEMSDAVRYENTARMLHLADLARLAAEACPVAVAGSAPELADLRSLGWRQYANSLRVCGRMREAEEAFAHAKRYCEEGTGDPHLRAALLARLGSLRYFQRRFDEAIALADEVGRIYSELGERALAATSMVQKAIAQIYAGEPAAAVQTLNRAIPLIENQDDPHLLLAACQNLIIAYIEMDEPEHALSLSFEVRSLYEGFQDPLIALRAGWKEARLLRNLGHLRAAEVALLQAREGFGARELLYEVAMVSLDLSDVYLRLDETGKLHETVAETVPIFKALGVDREMLAALLQLGQARQQSRQAFELIRFLSSRLEEHSQRQTPG